MMGEYGRNPRFMWSDTAIKIYGDDAQVTICEFTNTQRPYYITLGELKKIVKLIEKPECVGEK